LSKAWRFISRITAAVFQLDSQLKNGSATSSSSSSGSSNRGAVTKNRKTLVLDLDETLIHSTIKTTEQGFDYQVPVIIENISYIFYIFKRPHVEYFLEKVSEWFDVVIFTASLKQYAAPVIERLDTKRLVKGVLYRESCVLRNGNLIKDLGFAGFDVATTIIIDNSPIAYSLNKGTPTPPTCFFSQSQQHINQTRLSLQQRTPFRLTTS
jgi:CTD nuclear envelope phosphatase 1